MGWRCIWSIIFFYGYNICECYMACWCLQFTYDCDGISEIFVTIAIPIAGGCMWENTSAGMFIVTLAQPESHINWLFGACLYDCDFYFHRLIFATVIVGGDMNDESCSGLFRIDPAHLVSWYFWNIGACISLMIVIMFGALPIYLSGSSDQTVMGVMDVAHLLRYLIEFLQFLHVRVLASLMIVICFPRIFHDIQLY